MPRLFVGLEIPYNAGFALSLKCGGLPGARWIDQEKFHITLRFIGDVDQRTAEDVSAALYNIDHEPFELSLSNLDMFASRKPHSLWASVSPSEPLMALQSDIERSMRRIGMPPESRKFTPHVKIARIKGTSYEEAARYLTEQGDFASSPFQVTSFVLLSSRSSVGGGQYLLEDRFELYDDDFGHRDQDDYMGWYSSP